MCVKNNKNVSPMDETVWTREKIRGNEPPNLPQSYGTLWDCLHEPQGLKCLNERLNAVVLLLYCKYCLEFILGYAWCPTPQTDKYIVASKVHVCLAEHDVPLTTNISTLALPPGNRSNLTPSSYYPSFMSQRSSFVLLSLHCVWPVLSFILNQTFL